MQSEPLPVYLLAGGRSSRFGSDKARALLHGHPLILQIAERLRPVASSIQVIADQADKYADLGLKTCIDLRPGAGPLGGLESALDDLNQHRIKQSCDQDWLLLMSCDLWGVTADQLARLLSVDRKGVQAIAWKGEHWEPLCALYHHSLRVEVKRRLDAGQGAMWQLLEAVPAIALPAIGLNWVQINRRSDLDRLHALTLASDLFAPDFQLPAGDAD